MKLLALTLIIFSCSTAHAAIELRNSNDDVLPPVVLCGHDHKQTDANGRPLPVPFKVDSNGVLQTA